MPPAKKTAAKKKMPDASPAAAPTTWEWIGDDGKWNKFAAGDALLLEKEWKQQGPKARFATSALSFCNGGKHVYHFDFKGMVQRNAKTQMARAIRRDGNDGDSGGLPATKKAKTAAAEWWSKNDAGNDWMRMNDADAMLLENAWKPAPKAEVEMTGFSFAPTWKYKISFKKMTQTNPVTKKTREIARGDGTGKKPDGKPFPTAASEKWQFWHESGKWADFDEKDMLQLEVAYSGGAKYFMTFAPSFRSKHVVSKPYIFDFETMTQLNTEVGTSRSMRRGTSGGTGSVKIGSSSSGPVPIISGPGDDDVAHMSAMAKIAGPMSKTGAHGKTHVSAPIPPVAIPASVVTAQVKNSAQSLRPDPKATADYGVPINSDDHARDCFDTMLDRERKLVGKHAVFYHSYSHAALLYEVQAAVGAVLFRFKSEASSLPRLLFKPFEHIPTAARMLEEFPKWGAKKDHHEAFLHVGCRAHRSPNSGRSQSTRLQEHTLLLISHTRHCL